MIDFRPIESSDIEELRQLRNKQYIWQFLSNSFLINQEEQKEWYLRQSLDSTKQYFGIYDKKLIGCVWYDNWDKINSNCRIGIFIDKPYWNKGYSTQILKKFIKYLQDNLNIHRIWLLVHELNIYAILLYKSLGFVEEGIQKEAIYRNGKYYNYIMMSKIWSDFVNFTKELK